jgi:acetone carboxylase gamma subunit
MRIHEYLEIVCKGEGQKAVIRCMKCGYEFCPADENYKKYTLVWERDLKDLPLRTPVSGDPMFTRYQEFICPGCGTLLDVNSFCPEIDENDPIVWDIQIKI